MTKENQFKKDFALKQQICRASIGIMSNIAEGYDRGGTIEFLQFLSVAKGSVAEVRSQLYVALDQNYINKSEFDRLSELSIDTGKMIGGLMNYLRKTDKKVLNLKELQTLNSKL